MLQMTKKGRFVVLFFFAGVSSVKPRKEGQADNSAVLMAEVFLLVFTVGQYVH